MVYPARPFCFPSSLAVFDAPLLPFTIPALLTVVLWLVAAFGLFSFDADVDFDLDADTPLLGWIGLGTVPAVLLVTLLLFAFGWLGLGLHPLVADGLGLTGWTATGVAAPVALVGAVAATGLLGRPLGRLFRSEEATGRQALVGKTGSVSSGTLTDTFGSVTLRTPAGPVEVNARAETGVTLPYGQKVLVYDHDAHLNLYYVSAYDE